MIEPDIWTAAYGPSVQMLTQTRDCSALHSAPAVPDPRTASASHCQIFALVQGGISIVLVDLAPLTAVVLSTTNLTATLPAEGW